MRLIQTLKGIQLTIKVVTGESSKRSKEIRGLGGNTEAVSGHF